MRSNPFSRMEGWLNKLWYILTTVYTIPLKMNEDTFSVMLWEGFQDRWFSRKVNFSTEKTM